MNYLIEMLEEVVDEIARDIQRDSNEMPQERARGKALERLKKGLKKLAMEQEEDFIRVPDQDVFFKCPHCGEPFDFRNGEGDPEHYIDDIETSDDEYWTESDCPKCKKNVFVVYKRERKRERVIKDARDENAKDC